MPEEIKKRGNPQEILPYECVSLLTDTRTYDFVFTDYNKKFKFLMALTSLLKEKETKNKGNTQEKIELPSFFDLIFLQMKIKIEHMAMLSRQNKCLLFMVDIYIHIIRKLSKEL